MWVKTSEEVSWQALVEALEAVGVEEEEVEVVRAKYCSTEEENTGDSVVRVTLCV